MLSLNVFFRDAESVCKLHKNSHLWFYLFFFANTWKINRYRNIKSPKGWKTPNNHKSGLLFFWFFLNIFILNKNSSFLTRAFFLYILVVLAHKWEWQFRPSPIFLDCPTKNNSTSEPNSSIFMLPWQKKLQPPPPSGVFRSRVSPFFF